MPSHLNSQIPGDADRLLAPDTVPGDGALPATVLVVDDLDANARLLERLLEREGYRVIFAKNGHEALDRVRREHPDLILMDVIMPGMGGLETCQLLKSDPETRLVPVVLVTALQTSADRVRGLEVGADDFISRPLNTAELTARVRSLIRIKRFTDELDSAESVILSLARTIEERDASTDGHCQRLAHYGVIVGRELGVSESDQLALEKGGFLHDLGKVGIPDSILLKKDKLTVAERSVMEGHTVIGDRLCGGLRSLKYVRPIVRYHHERLDGSGYPEGLRGDTIPFLAQIMSVVDVFDALLTVRPYKPAYSLERACRELSLEASRGWRNRLIVDCVLALARDGQFGHA